VRQISLCEFPHYNTKEEDKKKFIWDIVYATKQIATYTNSHVVVSAEQM